MLKSLIIGQNDKWLDPGDSLPFLSPPERSDQGFPPLSPHDVLLKCEGKDYGHTSPADSLQFFARSEPILDMKNPADPVSLTLIQGDVPETDHGPSFLSVRDDTQRTFNLIHSEDHQKVCSDCFTDKLRSFPPFNTDLYIMPRIKVEVQW